MSADPIIEILDQRPLPRRRRRSYTGQAQALTTLPADWRELLERWVRRGGNSRWETLLKDAGVARQQMAQSLLDWLLRHGWAAVEEERKHGDWWPLKLELRELPQLKLALGLPDVADLAAQREALLVQLEAEVDPAMEPVIEALEAMPVQRALERVALVLALLDWRAQGRSGTRRDFALHARRDTKDITEAEWRWLDEQLDLSAFNIERHIPLLLVAAPLALQLPGGRIELGAFPDFAALTPNTVAAATAALGNIKRWLLVENRTSFDRGAQQRAPDEGVLWLPGYPPHWWLAAVAKLLALSPAPARIACDPDPAGIAIALAAAALWQEAGLGFEPWRMLPADLLWLPKRKALTLRDREHVQRLLTQDLPPMLRDLAEAMLQCGEKGEQEGYL
ncbi:MAG TPA: hypothetical protein VFX55_18445 [Duganella sp.]|nr:hypothetical protein [Duganella sp.]